MIPPESSPSMVRETLNCTPKTKPFLFGPPMFLFLSHPHIILWLSSQIYEISFWFNKTTNVLQGKVLIIPPILCYRFIKLGLNWRTGLNRFLTSWKSKDDLGIDNYSYQMVPTRNPQMSLYMGQTLLWCAGSWTSLRWSGVPKMTSNYFNISFVNNQDEVTIMYGTSSKLASPKVFTKMVVGESGIMQWLLWHKTRWVEYQFAPQELCDKYLNCGPNSYCDLYKGVNFECMCFPRFEPKLSRDWYFRDRSNGCVREK